MVWTACEKYFYCTKQRGNIAQGRYFIPDAGH
jgi:hypothetical protein